MIVIPEETNVGKQLEQAAATKHIVMFSGIPGVGKSLMLQQMSLYAEKAGRKVYLMQWDLVRKSFETEKFLKKYPEIDGVTHAAVRKAVGLWCRQAISRWNNENNDLNNILIIELPVIGGRLVELMHPEQDDVEMLLSSDDVITFTIVPSVNIRKKIIGVRNETIANPRNDKENRDAPDAVLNDLWATIRKIYNIEHGIDSDDQIFTYDVDIYKSVFSKITQYRNAAFLDIDTLYPTKGSAYDMVTATKSFTPTSEEVITAYARLDELYSDKNLNDIVESWYDF